MRSFIGTSIDSGTIRLIKPHLSGIGEPPWRIAPVSQWHVTSLFIGEHDRTESIQKVMAGIAAATPPIVLEHGRLRTMPVIDPHMLWVRFDPCEALTDLHEKLAAVTGIAPSHKPYTPHITIARTRRKVERIEGGVIVPNVILDHLTLFHTQLRPEGSIHTPVFTCPIGRTGPIGPVEGA